MISAIVLAGGDSSRIGTDKAMLILGDRPLISWVTAAFDGFDQVLISISSEFQGTKYDLFIEIQHEFILDKYRNKGTLGGLLTATEAAEGDIIIVSPCDTPFISAELYRFMLEHAEGREGAAPKIGGHWEPLVAVYKKAPLLSVLEEKNRTGDRRVGTICEAMDINAVGANEFEKANISIESLLNINEPKDMEKAIRFMEAQKTY